ncbi:helix-turn-helix transcriptional regulator [Latilactobacillus sakei]
MTNKVEKLNLKTIQKLREKKGLTKSEMAKLMGFKTTEKYSRREKGEYNFQVDELPLMASILKVSIKNFFG